MKLVSKLVIFILHYLFKVSEIKDAEQQTDWCPFDSSLIYLYSSFHIANRCKTALQNILVSS